MKQAFIQRLIGKLGFVILTYILLSCGNENKQENKIAELDQKYLSESQLFALNQAIENDPDDPENYFKRSKVYLDRNEKAKALRDIEQAIKFKNSEGKYYYQKALILYYSNQPVSAFQSAKNAESLNINNAELKLLLARLNLEIGNLPEAQKYLDQSIALTPNHPEIYFIKGKTFAMQGDTSNAVANYFITISRDTNNADAYKELSQIYFNKHKYDSALVFAATGIIADPEEPFFYYQEGRILEQQHLISSAKTYYQLALVHDKEFPNAYASLAKLYHKEGDDTKAIQFLEQELKYYPKDLSSNLLLADIYMKKERGDLAIPVMERILSLDSNQKSIKMNLEKLYVLYPDRKPKPQEVKVDTTAKEITPKPIEKPKVEVKKDTVKKTVTPKPKVKEENRNFIPKIVNPDSTKIERRQDSSN